MTAIGVRRPRIDSDVKVTGALRYAADLPIPGLVHARLVTSLYAHARIVRIDASAALTRPGVVAVITAADLPIVNPSANRTGEPLAREEVVFAGQPVAIVVAETEAQAEDAVEAVEIEYEPLPVVLDLEAAFALDAPAVRVTEPAGEAETGASAHAEVGESDQEAEPEALSPNVFASHRHVSGDAGSALDSCDVVVEGRFKTSWVYQAYLEPQVCIARVEPTGELTIESSTQGIYWVRDTITCLYGLPVSQVVVKGTPLGGAFGAKFMLVEPLTAGAALVVRRPVRLALTRSEDFSSTQPAPGSLIDLRIGANADGSLAGLETRILFDSGAFTDWAVESIAAVLIAGPYLWPAFAIRSYGVRTNRVGTGAYRGPAGPQAAFALESLLDELAERLELDPIEFRLRNVASEGDPMVDGKPWPRIGIRECLEAVRDHPLWQRRSTLPPNEGVGIAAAGWPGAKSSSGAVCRFDPDGGLTVFTGAVDMSGTASTFAAIAAETFGIPVEQVRVVAGDTSNSPMTPASGGSMVTYSVGGAVLDAAANARKQLLEIAASELEVDAADLEIADGNVRPVGAPSRGVSLEDLARRFANPNASTPPIQANGGSAPKSQAPSHAAHLAHVRVDEETGEVRVLQFALAQDVGTAINPALVEGQMRGGVAQGIGWALLEEYLHDDEGNLLTGSLMSYAVPSAQDVPEIETMIVQVPSPDGPFGAKGMAEGCVLAAPAAIANAVAAAAGIRPRELPMTPRRVWAAMQSASLSGG